MRAYTERFAFLRGLIPAFVSDFERGVCSGEARLAARKYFFDFFCVAQHRRATTARRSTPARPGCPVAAERAMRRQGCASAAHAARRAAGASARRRDGRRATRHGIFLIFFRVKISRRKSERLPAAAALKTETILLHFPRNQKDFADPALWADGLVNRDRVGRAGLVATSGPARRRLQALC